MVQFLEIVKGIAQRTKPVERVINEETVRFYPITPFDLYQLRGLSSDIAEAFGLLFTSRGAKATSRDSEAMFRSVKSTGEDEGEITENVVGAISVEMAKLRTEQATEAYKKLASLVLERQNMEIIAKIILSSLRAEDKGDPLAAKAMMELDLPVFLKFLGGMLDASGESMGRLGKDIGRVLKDGIAPTSEDNLSEVEESERENSKEPLAT